MNDTPKIYEENMAKVIHEILMRLHNVETSTMFLMDVLIPLLPENEQQKVMDHFLSFRDSRDAMSTHKALMEYVAKARKEQNASCH